MANLRYSDVSDLRKQLSGVNLDPLKETDWGGDSSAELADLLTQDLLDAEVEVDSICGRGFEVLAKHVDILCGDGSTSLLLNHVPIYDVQQVLLRYDPQSVGFALDPLLLRIDKETGYVSVRPNLAAASIGAIGASSIGLSRIFPSGENNVVVQYRTGYAQIGDNVGLSLLASGEFPDVATMSVDATYAYMNLSKPFGPCKANALLTTRPQHVMLKDGVDDSANWTMVHERQLRCALAHYSAVSQWVFVYVPHAVSGAAVDLGAAGTLGQLGSKAGAGGAGGAISVSAGPFKADYGEGQYSAQIKDFTDSAERKLRPYRRAL